MGLQLNKCVGWWGRVEKGNDNLNIAGNSDHHSTQ